MLIKKIYRVQSLTLILQPINLILFLQRHRNLAQIASFRKENEKLIEIASNMIKNLVPHSKKTNYRIRYNMNGILV